MFNEITLANAVFSRVFPLHFKLAILWKINEIITHISSRRSLWVAWAKQVRSLFYLVSAHWYSRCRIDVHRDGLEAFRHPMNVRIDEDFDGARDPVFHWQPRFLCISTYSTTLLCTCTNDRFSCALLRCASRRESFFDLIVTLCWVAAALTKYGLLKNSLLTLNIFAM